MFGTLAHLMYRRRPYVLGVWFVLLIIAGTQAAQVNKILGPGDFAQKGSDSAKAAAILDRVFHQNANKTTLVLVSSPAQTVRSASFRRTLAAMTARTRADRGLRVEFIQNPLTTDNAQLISRDGHSLALLISSNLTEQQLESQIDRLRSIVRTPGYTTYVLGTAAANHDYANSSKTDLSRGETITVPILIVILLLVFGSLVAAVVPLILAVFAILLSLALVFIVGHVLDTSIYVTNVVTFLGLGIAIDYSLFIVYRFREELRRTGGDVEASIVRAMQTTGRAVFFSGLAVAIGLSSLILTGLTFMQSMGLGGMLVPLTALAVSMTLLPALLGYLGPRVNAVRLVPERFLSTGEGGLWHGLALGIMRRPVVSGLAVLIGLLALAYQTTHLAFAFGSLKNANQSLESVQGYLFMQARFNTVADPAQLVVQERGAGTLLAPAAVQGLQRLEAALRRDPEAIHIIGPVDFLSPAGTIPPAARQAVTGRYLSPDLRTAVITAVPRDDVGTKANEDMVRRYRVIARQFQAAGPLSGTAIYVGGAQAQYTDFNDAMYARFPEIVVLVLVLTYIFLFFAFRSVFLPLKAVLLNLLSVGASYGMLQLVFQRGFLSGPLGFKAESGVASWVPIFLFAFLFGLSMDYEVFLLSRMREHWLATHSNRASVALGLEKTGRLITSAALIMIVAFTGILIGHEIQLKEFGFGMLAAIAIDASLIRIILVPAIMEIMGDWNWWVPARLRAFASRGVTFSEGVEAAASLEPDRHYALDRPER